MNHMFTYNSIAIPPLPLFIETNSRHLHIYLSIPSMKQSLLISLQINNSIPTPSIIISKMPKHKSPIERLIDPFSIPAQMNNLGVLIIAYSTKSILARDTCSDSQNLSFLNFIYYGSMITCVGTALMSILYMIGLLDYCINKVMPCGEVCLTLNTVLIFLAGLLYHCAATVFGLYEFIWGKQSGCVQLQMFTQITCWIYFCWFVTIILYLLVNLCYLNRKRQLPTVEQNYTEMK